MSSPDRQRGRQATAARLRAMPMDAGPSTAAAYCSSPSPDRRDVFLSSAAADLEKDS